MKALLFFLMIFAVADVAFAHSDLLDAVKVTKALIEAGDDISNPVAVETAEQMSIPPLRCVMIVLDRKPNTECPDSPIGSYIDRGSFGCLSDTTNEVVKIGSFTNACP